MITGKPRVNAQCRLCWYLGVTVVTFVMLFLFYGYENTWRLWNVPVMSPHFADLRVITAGSESKAMGLDPMIGNPADPWQRPLNYPRIWQSLTYLGVDQGDTTYIGIGFIFLFLVGLCLAFTNIDKVEALSVMLAVLSPSVLLGIERANSDLLMFFLLAVSIFTVDRHHILSTAALLFGFILKLFPLFALVVLLKKSRSIFAFWTTISITFAAVYAFCTFDDLLLISKNTPRAIFRSYGVNRLWMTLIIEHPQVGVYVKAASYLLACLIFAIAVIVAVRRAKLPQHIQDMPYLDSFRVGSAIYVGTFLLGNNFDYRLMFLIFTIPQLLVWITDCSISVRWTSRISLAALYMSMWTPILLPIVTDSPYLLFWFLVDEISHWSVFAGMLYLLFSMISREPSAADTGAPANNEMAPADLS